MNILSGKKKILTMVLGIVSGLAIAFGLDQSEVSTIAGAVISVSSVISYMMAEGKIDLERIRNASEAVNDALEVTGFDDVIVQGFGGYEDQDEGADSNV